MDLHRSMEAFVEIANAGNIAAAARKLGVSAPTGSRLLQDLEDWVAAPLVRRTTRRLTLTKLGENYLPRCIEILENTNALRDMSVESVHQHREPFTVTVSSILARTIVAPIVPQFVRDYPDVKLTLNVSDARIDVMAENVDLAIRLGALPDSTLISKRLSDIKLKLVAAPEFLKTHGTPASVDDILNTVCIIDTTPSFENRWPITGGKPTFGLLSVNSGDIATRFAIDGLGLAYLPEPYVIKHIDSGALQEIAIKGSKLDMEVFAVFPPKKYIKDIARDFGERVKQKCKSFAK